MQLCVFCNNCLSYEAASSVTKQCNVLLESIFQVKSFHELHPVYTHTHTHTLSPSLALLLYKYAQMLQTKETTPKLNQKKNRTERRKLQVVSRKWCETFPRLRTSHYFTTNVAHECLRHNANEKQNTVFYCF